MEREGGRLLVNDADVNIRPLDGAVGMLMGGVGYTVTLTDGNGGLRDPEGAFVVLLDANGNQPDDG